MFFGSSSFVHSLFLVYSCCCCGVPTYLLIAFRLTHSLTYSIVNIVVVVATVRIVLFYLLSRFAILIMCVCNVWYACIYTYGKSYYPNRNFLSTILNDALVYILIVLRLGWHNC